ncbi:MAG: hypothetical protein LBU41_05960, partial [Clostridiales Family XIII bacterium]|jgi:hypothetical protein|nr:hypothetical protein [Clostridiales Family XIII bacterium]
MAFPKSESFFVDGVTPDRLTNPNANGFPTVIWLKQGETVSIIGLPEATYQITEYPPGTTAGNAYKTSSRITLDATSAQMGIADGTTTQIIDLLNGSQTVVFVNQSSSDIRPTDHDKSPATGDAGNQYLLFAMIGAAGLLLLAVRYFFVAKFGRRGRGKR